MITSNKLVHAALILSMLLLSGCAGLFTKSYGKAARDGYNAEVNNGNIEMPENAPSIAQGYDPNPISDDGGSTAGHDAIDIVGKRGSPVLAAAAGTVRAAYYEPFYGSRIVIDNGAIKDGKFVRTVYFHLTKRLVKKGDVVRRGQQIATLGSTGMLASYPHLHFEVRVGDSAELSRFDAMNPHRYWANGVAKPTCFDVERKWPDKPFATTYPVPCRMVKWN